MIMNMPRRHFIHLYDYANKLPYIPINVAKYTYFDTFAHIYPYFNVFIYF